MKSFLHVPGDPMVRTHIAIQADGAAFAAMLPEIVDHERQAILYDEGDLRIVSVWTVDTGQPEVAWLKWQPGDYDEEGFRLVTVRLVRPRSYELIDQTSYVCDGNA